MRHSNKKQKRRLAFGRLDQKGIPLAEVIAVHEQFRGKNTLPANLGDGFLYAQNPVFRSVRREYLRLGFSFTQHDFCDYFAFPLMALDEVTTAGKIPYRNNAVWLKKIEKATPGTFTLTTLKRSELQFNYLFHESAHFIAHAAFFGKKRVAALPKDQGTLLRIMLGEALANTVECLSAAFAEGEIETYFLNANCHFRANAKEVKVLRRGVEKLGTEAVACILFASFLYSNFLFERLSKKQKTLILTFAKAPKAKLTNDLVHIGLQLSEEFRQTTTPLHLWKLKFPSNLPRLLQFDPLARLLKPENSLLRSQVSALLALLARP